MEIKLIKSENEDEFAVERIIDKRKNDAGETEYMVKWLGFRDDQNSWEKEPNLFCDALISEFEAKANQIRNSEEDESSADNSNDYDYDTNKKKCFFWSNKAF